MQFHNWQPMLDEAGKINPKEKKLPLDERLKIEIDRIKEFPFRIKSNMYKRLLRASSEFLWATEGRPYYNIHPAMISHLSKIDLDKIPVELIEIPNDFHSICVRFSNNVPIRYKDNEHMLFGQQEGDDPIQVRCVLFSSITNPKDLKELNLDEDRGFVMHLDEGVRTHQRGVDCVVCNTFRFTARKDETIPHALQRNLDELSKSSDQSDYLLASHLRQKIEALFKVVVSVGFLANAPEDGVIVPDVLSNDASKYKEAVSKGDQERIEVIENRAKRRGKVGWNVGTNEIFVGESGFRSKPPIKGEGKQLQYSHIRQGHFHAVRFGKNKEKIKLKWYRSKRIREDLPFKST